MSYYVNDLRIRQALAVHTARQLRLMFLMQAQNQWQSVDWCEAWDKGMNYSDQAIDMAKAEERRARGAVMAVCEAL